MGDSLLEQANKETNLPMPRLTGERGRTCFQLRMFATMLKEGNYVEASIDTAIPTKTPPKPDIRKMMHPIGPVVVLVLVIFLLLIPLQVAIRLVH